MKPIKPIVRTSRQKKFVNMSFKFSDLEQNALDEAYEADRVGYESIGMWVERKIFELIIRPRLEEKAKDGE